MKVLFITNMYPTRTHPYYGIHVKEQIENLEKLYGIQGTVFFINSLEKGKSAYLLSIPAIIKTIRAYRPDNIHIHYGLSALFLFFYRPKGNIFLTLHGGDILDAQGKQIQVSLTKKIIKRITKVFILNKEMESIVSQLTSSYEMIPCGVDTDFFNSSLSKEELNQKIILFPGDPKREVKNFPLFMETVEILKKKCKYDIQVEIVHGLKRKEVVRLLATSDCLVMTSLSEGSPQIIKEALSTNLSVVSVPVGDVDVVMDGIPGCYVTKTFEPNEISDHILRSFEDKAKDIRYHFLKKKFDQASAVKRIFNNYQ